MCNEMVVQVICFLRHFSEELSRLAARKYARIIQKLGFNVCLVCCLFVCLFVFLFICLGNEPSSLHLCYLLLRFSGWLSVIRLRTHDLSGSFACAVNSRVYIVRGKDP